MAESKKGTKTTKKPASFRLLKMADPDEAAAYQAGYRYIDADDMAYTHEEAEKEGWI